MRDREEGEEGMCERERERNKDQFTTQKYFKSTYSRAFS
jgi:hypothetical protein